MNKRILSIILFGFLIAGINSAQPVAGATLNVRAKDVIGDQEAYKVTFGTIPAKQDFAPANQYIEIEYSGDTALWAIDIYTDNKTAETGYQRGGLLSKSTTTARIPLLWSVYDVQGEVQCSTITWHWIKDKGDENIPPEPGQEDKYDESWDNAQSAGYAQVIYGQDDWSNLPAVPTKVDNAQSPVFVYLSADLRAAAAGDYSTTICFDLYHLAPPPVISHTPIERIGIIGNKIVFNADITDNKSVESATIHYKIDKSGNWQVKGMALKGSATEKTGTYVLPPQAISGPCQIYYWLEASDGEGNIGLWENKDESSPQIIEVTQGITEIVGPKGGKVILPDENPDDGEVMVDIPEGALSKNTKITIEQITDLSRIPGYSEGGDWKPVAVYNFIQEGTRFKKLVTMNLLYFDLDSNGKPEDWKGEEKDFEENQVACYWWDGFNWRPAGGKIDRERNVATLNVSHFSYYGLFKVRPMGFSEYRPKERIITPACADGKNDVAYFSGLTGQVATVRIYDITGKKIRTIDEEPYEWDGTDDDGNIVESGVYIYQFKADVEGKKRMVSGTIAVAK
jgi:hypothetical protein